ncbi:MAG TPA: type II secretion system protein [Chthoniobacter sp.]|nr:type II secretion system protein [Chthoniobacter sp.]
MRSHSRHTRAFTLVEMMVATGLVGVASLAMISVMVSTMKLSSQNVVTNISNYRARQTLDRLGEIVRYAQDTPVLITNAGATTTGSSDGILVKNALPGTYVFKNANGKDDDIPSGSTSFMVQYAPKSTLPGIMPTQDATLLGQKVEPPVVGDYFLLGLSSHPELEVASVSAVSAVSGTISSVIITTKQATTETATPKNYTVSGARYRKEAYLFVQSGTQWTLRHYPRVVASTSYSSASSYFELGTGFQKIGTQAWFTTTAANGTQATLLQAIARSSNHAEYAEKISNHTTLTTMPVQVKLWNYNPPPPSS